MTVTSDFLLHGTERTSSWYVQLPFEKPLSLNDRPGNAMVSWRMKKMWRTGTWEALVRAKVPACPRVRARLYYVPSTNRRRDPDNLVASFKPVVDALMDAGVVPDDTQDYVEREWPFIAAKDPALTGGRFFLQLTRLE